ncbi:hypothetical protein [Bartonella rattimassiliensis]|uniref:Uncharacterized protein n=1 Tax=Bartonella rattimassiliensis 15908 TaxID=1094556 RepID=J1JRU7_9HYPH|nr:hypothetical protein [Bartonella rattimassiliensis]EJF87150.1 hypothetical protein MCY_00274 [Bartonella rattimassiliensis 15908]
MDGAVKYDKDEKGNKTNKISLIGGNESDPVLIDNVAERHIENGSKEAINGERLYDYPKEQMKTVLDDTKKYTDKRFDDVIDNAMSNVINEAKSYTDTKFEALKY